MKFKRIPQQNLNWLQKLIIFQHEKIPSFLMWYFLSMFYALCLALYYIYIGEPNSLLASQLYIGVAVILFGGMLFTKIIQTIYISKAKLYLAETLFLLEKDKVVACTKAIWGKENIIKVELPETVFNLKSRSVRKKFKIDDEYNCIIELEIRLDWQEDIDPQRYYEQVVLKELENIDMYIEGQLEEFWRAKENDFKECASCNLRSSQYSDEQLVAKRNKLQDFEFRNILGETQTSIDIVRFSVFRKTLTMEISKERTSDLVSL